MSTNTTNDDRTFSAIRHVRFEVEIKVHIGIFNGGNGFDMIHTKGFRDLIKVGSGHIFEKPRNDLFNGFGLLLCEFINESLLCDMLNVEIVRSLPRCSLGMRCRQLTHGTILVSGTRDNLGRRMTMINGGFLGGRRPVYQY